MPGIHPDGSTNPDNVQYGVPEGYPCYLVGDDGSVWSRLHSIINKKLGNKYRKLTSSGSKKRRRMVRLYNGNQRKMIEVSRLVLWVFTGFLHTGRSLYACHNNGNHLDDRLVNLRWGTPASNMADKIIHGTMLVGERCSYAKLRESDVVQIRLRKKCGASNSELAKEFGVSPALISRVDRRVCWRHI